MPQLVLQVGPKSVSASLDCPSGPGLAYVSALSIEQRLRHSGRRRILTRVVGPFAHPAFGLRSRCAPTTLSGSSFGGIVQRFQVKYSLTFKEGYYQGLPRQRDRTYNIMLVALFAPLGLAAA